MTRTAAVRQHRRWAALAAAGLLAMIAAVAATATSTAYAVGHRVPSDLTTAGSTERTSTAGTTVSLTSSATKVSSSTGRKLRVQVLAVHSGSGTHVAVTVETRDRTEAHEWDFPVPASAMSLSRKGKGAIHLTSHRSGRYAVLSLRSAPHGKVALSKCQGKVATRTRHVALTGSLLLHTRSTGQHAWGTVGSTHRTLHFATGSKVTWSRPVAQICADRTTTLPCRDTLLWLASGVGGDRFRLLAGENKGTGSWISGSRSVQLPKPAGATRTDSHTVPDASPATLADNGDGTVTMNAAFRAGAASMTSDIPESTVVQRCAGGGKISVSFWAGTYTNGPTPIRVPEQVFGALSVDDGSAAGLYQISKLG